MAEVCSERGAGNVTVADVVARSGVSRRTFYESFQDREECFLEALEEALAYATRQVLPVYEASGDWRERIRASLVALLAFFEEEPFMGRLLIVESLGGGPAALARRREVLARVIAAVDGGRGIAADPSSLAPLIAEGLLGGVLGVIHAQLVEPDGRPLLELVSPLMSMIVLPYLGPRAARKELERPVPSSPERANRSLSGPLRDLQMRLTYRTVRVLIAVGGNPSASNREVGVAADIQDQGQISKLLTRLARLGLVENTGAGYARGGPNAWMLTDRGLEIQQAIGDLTEAS